MYLGWGSLDLFCLRLSFLHLCVFFLQVRKFSVIIFQIGSQFLALSLLLVPLWCRYHYDWYCFRGPLDYPYFLILFFFPALLGFILLHCSSRQWFVHLPHLNSCSLLLVYSLFLSKLNSLKIFNSNYMISKEQMDKSKWKWIKSKRESFKIRIEIFTSHLSQWLYSNITFNSMK